MNGELAREAEYQRYIEFQAAMRPGRVETLGGAATALFLATIDLGLSPTAETRETDEAGHFEVENGVEIAPLSQFRQRGSATFAPEMAERGYAEAA